MLPCTLCVYTRRWYLLASDLKSSWRCAQELSHSGATRWAHMHDQMLYISREKVEPTTVFRCLCVVHISLFSSITTSTSWLNKLWLHSVCTLTLPHAIPGAMGDPAYLPCTGAVYICRPTKNAHTRNTVQLRGRSSSNKWRNTTNSSSAMHSQTSVVSLNQAYSL